jgi:hypothetical protein
VWIGFELYEWWLRQTSLKKSFIITEHNLKLTSYGACLQPTWKDCQTKTWLISLDG